MRISRRAFCYSFAGVAAWLTAPGLAASSEAGAATVSPTAEALAVTDEIRSLELALQQHPGSFDWEVHNELRHLYGAISEQRSMYHADVILAHSVMDEYMLDILSEWQLGQDLELAAAQLGDKIERHPSLPHLRAACLLKIGEIRAVRGNRREAGRHFQSVVALNGRGKRQDRALQTYRALAKHRLREL